MKTICLLLAAVLIASCQGESKTEEKTNADKDGALLAAAEAGVSPFGADNLQSQSFAIEGSKDAVVTGKDGAVLRIPKNAFVDKSGSAVKGKVTIQLKEALSMTDIVMAGLVTTSDGKVLETGGMIYVGATAVGEGLAIAPGKEILATVPTGKKMDGMQIFDGVANDEGVINWVDPKDIIYPELKIAPVDDSVLTDEIQTEESSGEPKTEPPLKPVKYNEKGNDLITVNFENPDMFPEFDTYKNVQWQLVDQKSYKEGDAEKEWYSIKVDRANKKGVYTLTFTGRDTKGKVVKTYDVTPVFEGKDYDVAMAAYEKKFTEYQKDVKEQERLAKEERIRQQELALEQQRKWKEQQKRQQQAGKDVADAQIYGRSYVFPIKQLGWVNCDRFYGDPTAEEAIVEAKVSNTDEEGKAFAYLVFTRLNICLAGYRNAEGAFVFDNGYGSMKMPIGEKALVIAVSDSEDKQRFAMAETTIAKEVSLNLQLAETTPKKMRQLLDEKLKPQL